MNPRIARTDTSFYKYRDHAKFLIVFKRWRNCLILGEIIFQLKIPRDYRVYKKVLLKEEILPHYQNPRFFRTYANSNKMSCPLHVRINGCILY